MTPLRPTNFRLESELLEGLRQVRERDGIPVSVASTVVVPGGSVREAARVWGVLKSTAARWITSGTGRVSVVARQPRVG